MLNVDYFYVRDLRDRQIPPEGVNDQTNLQHIWIIIIIIFNNNNFCVFNSENLKAFLLP